MTVTALHPNPQRQVDPGTCGTCGGTRYSREGTSRRDCDLGCGLLRDRVRWAASMHQDLIERGWDEAHLPTADAILAAMVGQ